MSAREAARRWEEAAGSVVWAEAPTSVESIEDLTWSWQVGDVETGWMQFRDRGAGRAEAELEVHRTDDSAGERLAVIVERLTGVLSRPGIDPPVVLSDPDQGEPPDASTDADQPL